MKNKKLLIISPFCPCSPNIEGSNGGAPYWIVKNSKNCSIDLLYLNVKNEEFEADISKYCRSVQNIYFKKKHNFIFQILESYFKRIPKICNLNDLTKYYDYINRNYNLDSYDNILIVSSEISGLLKYFDKNKIVLFAIDSFPMWYYRRSKTEKNIFKKLYYYTQYQLFIKYEKNKITSYTNRIVFVSDIDKKFEIEKIKSHNFYSITHGVEIPEVYDNNLFSKEYFNLVFSGQMAYEPNNDAALYFLNEIFPKIKKEIPNVKLYLVGKNPSQEILNQATSDVIVTGFVDNIYSYISSADVYISPLRYGTGVKNKILEAMSCKKAIIASDISIEGIDHIIENVNYLRANNLDEWLFSLKKLYNDRDLIKKMGNQNYETILEFFSWNNTLCDLMGWDR